MRPWIKKRCERVHINGLCDAITCWLADFDTRLLELAVAISAIISGLGAISYDDHSEPLAPFLHSQLSSLAYGPAVWCVLLLGIGALQLLALAVGTARSQLEPRIAMGFVGMALWWIVVAAIVTGEQAPFIALRYGWTALLCFFVYVVLSVQNAAHRHFEGTFQGASQGGFGADDRNGTH